MILRESKIDHYRCLLCFPLFGGDRGLFLGNYRFTGTWGEGSRLPGSELRLIVVASVFLLKRYASTGWQNLKCVSHPLQHRSVNRHSSWGRRSRLVPCIWIDGFGLIRWSVTDIAYLLSYFPYLCYNVLYFYSYFCVNYMQTFTKGEGRENKLKAHLNSDLIQN